MCWYVIVFSLLFTALFNILTRRGRGGWRICKTRPEADVGGARESLTSRWRETIMLLGNLIYSFDLITESSWKLSGGEMETAVL